MVKVFLGIPTNWKAIDTNHVTSLLLLDKTFVSDIAAGRGGSIPHIRNGLVELFLKTDCTHLFMADCDGVIPQDAINRLLEAGKPVISGIQASHSEPYFKSMFDKRLRPYVGTYFTDPLYEITQMYATGFPAVLIKREVFNTIQPPWFEMKYLTPDDGCDEEDTGTFVSTDNWFAEQCYRCEIPIFVHPSVLVGHLTNGIVNLKGINQVPIFEQIHEIKPG